MVLERQENRETPEKRAQTYTSEHLHMRKAQTRTKGISSYLTATFNNDIGRQPPRRPVFESGVSDQDPGDLLRLPKLDVSLVQLHDDYMPLCRR